MRLLFLFEKLKTMTSKERAKFLKKAFGISFLDEAFNKNLPVNESEVSDFILGNRANRGFASTSSATVNGLSNQNKDLINKNISNARKILQTTMILQTNYRLNSLIKKFNKPYYQKASNKAVLEDVKKSMDILKDIPTFAILNKNTVQATEFSISKEIEDDDKWVYEGPTTAKGTKTGIIRSFCKTHAGKVYSTAEIDAWQSFSWQGKIPYEDVWLVCGGYNCRHSIIAVADEEDYRTGVEERLEREELGLPPEKDLPPKETPKKDVVLSEAGQKIVDLLKVENVEYNPVKKLENPLTEEEIVKRVSGGDLTTKGSCSSVAFAYIGNKNGLDVLDFRGGESERFFASSSNILKIADLQNKKTCIIYRHTNDFVAVNELLKQMKIGKEYYLGTGGHAAIIRRRGEKGVDFLELQDKIAEGNGFQNLTTERLKNRFGCQKTHTNYGKKYDARSFIFEVEGFNDNDDFKEILGYINTNEDKQMKGSKGSKR